MNSSKAINNLNFRQLAFNEVYLRFNEPKTRKQAFSILEAAIQCFDKRGFYNVTLMTISREAGVSRQFINYYFKSMDEIRETSIKYIRLIGQQLMLKNIADEKKPELIFSIYLKSHLIWLNNFKSHIRVWLNFLAHCTKKESDRTINTSAISIGNQRIQNFLIQGRQMGVFQHENDEATAIVIQTLISGWLVALVSENILNKEAFSEVIISHCFKTVGID